MVRSLTLWLAATLAASVVHGAPTTSDGTSTWGLPPQSSFGTPGNATYDYIIVGGGTAGLAVASRLAENPQLRVAVVEAGGFYEVDNGNYSTVPAYWPVGTETTANATILPVDWGFVTTPQAVSVTLSTTPSRGDADGPDSGCEQQAATLRGRENTWRVICSQCHAVSSVSRRCCRLPLLSMLMFIKRPTEGTLQQWASDIGDDSFTFARMLPFYKKSPHFTPQVFTYTNSTSEQDPTAFDAKGSPLQVSLGNYVDPFGTWAQYGFKALGQKLIRGFQSGNLIGHDYAPFTIDPISATRSSSEASFLQAAVRTTKIKVYNNTLAERILINSSNIATGVLVSSTHADTQPYVLTARREIILSAGALRSPQLLMVSGIGSRAQLSAQHIPIIKDLPGVGQNFWDQPFFPTSFTINLPSPSLPDVIAQYNTQQRGPLTLTSPGPLGWEKLPEPYRSNLSASTRQALESTFPPDWPELEWLPSPGAPGPLATNTQVATVVTCLVAPLSRGNITINSSSMTDPPIINPAWLTHPADAELAVQALRRQREFWSHLNITVGSEVLPGPTVQTNEEILGFIREVVSPIWHAAGTCKMGRSNDTMAVVDSAFKVMGIKALRVVDASVMPVLVPGHPQATIYAMAEKLAELILKAL